MKSAVHGSQSLHGYAILHRHIRLSDGLPPWSQSHYWPMVAWILRPRNPGIPGGGAGRHRKSARIALLPLPSLLTHFDAESESLRATKEKLQEFGGKSLILMILFFAILVTHIVVSGAYWRWAMLKLQLFTSSFEGVDFTFYGTL